jgi:hypothetical protein
MEKTTPGYNGQQQFYYNDKEKTAGEKKSALEILFEEDGWLEALP